MYMYNYYYLHGDIDQNVQKGEDHHFSRNKNRFDRY